MTGKLSFRCNRERHDHQSRLIRPSPVLAMARKVGAYQPDGFCERINYLVIVCHLVVGWGKRSHLDYRNLCALRATIPHAPFAEITAAATKALSDEGSS